MALNLHVPSKRENPTMADPAVSSSKEAVDLRGAVYIENPQKSSRTYATPENDTTSLPGLKSDTTSAGGRSS